MLPPKSNFSEWYHEIIQHAQIMDIRYPVKGLYVWFPFGFKLRKLVYGKLREIMDREHDEVYFPALIPETELGKEGQHIKGFEDEVYWITHGGMDELDVKLALRPTSETAMYPMFRLWIRSHADLPLKVYQVVNVFRYETKHTRPLIRLREITSFKEAHTAHRNYEEAEENVKKAISSYKEFYDSLAIPYFVIKRPEWDKFPGADYTIAFDTIMPDGRTLQIGTVHHLADNFAKTFDIKYETPEGDHAYIHQTCYGISERCIASLISIHGDDVGLILPFDFAPHQIVVIPILYKGKEELVMNVANRVYDRLKSMGFRVVMDDSDDRPGAKYYRWELFGVPLRIEIGPREAESNEAVISFRDEKVKRKISIEELTEDSIKTWAEEMHERLRRKALDSLAEKTKLFESISEIKEWIGKGVALTYLCSSTECGEELESLAGAGVLGEVLELPEGVEAEKDGSCVICGRPGKLNAIAKSY
ncbi:proline--tRNA ligase [Geoglobus acetivorans]|uniref:Proline--tRNA ligase n=1 Tax=Geoglobus acetivorans TaxID=565033 RepID=A0ABZ3H6F3_GEOAI|nr:proline--tRNA ligase [Geoglobus acetivorans]